jgi:hypothetical protein
MRNHSLVLLAVTVLLHTGSAWGAEADLTPYREYLNPGWKKMQNVLMLGWGCTEDDAKAFERNGAVNPFNGEKYDDVIPFGWASRLLEDFRAVFDNGGGWSLLTNYEKLRGLEIENLVCHSNGCDVAANAIKAGYIRVKNLYALAPPKGFGSEARWLPVSEVTIRWNKGDPIAEVLGKGLVVEPLQKAGDVDIWALPRPAGTGEPGMFIGFRVTGPLPGEHRAPDINRLVYEEPRYPFPKAGRVYMLTEHYEALLRSNPGVRHIIESHARPFNDHLTASGYIIELSWVSEGEKETLRATWRLLQKEATGPHAYRNIALNVVLEDAYARERSRPRSAELPALRMLAPEVAEVFAMPEYWTSEDGKRRGQVMTEARAMADLVKDKTRAIIVGRGPAADEMERIMAQRLGPDNVRRFRDHPGAESLSRAARAMGPSTAVLGIRGSRAMEAGGRDAPGRSTNGSSPNGGSDSGSSRARSESPPAVGGIDLRSLPVRYIELKPSERGRLVPAFAGACTTTRDGRHGEAVNASGAAFVTGVRTPDFKLWANLHPAEPDRIVDAALDHTDVGRILVVSDLLLKKHGARITDPRVSGAGRQYWARLAAPTKDGGAVNQANRVWIVPDRVVVARGQGDAYIEEARMRVELETRYFEQRDGRRPSATRAAEEITREMVTARLTTLVNEAPEYLELRQVFQGLILAHWYKETFGNGRPEAGPVCHAVVPWNKRSVWNDYVRSLREGEYHFTEESRKQRGNVIEVSRVTYFSGGVDFTRLRDVVRYTSGLTEARRGHVREAAGHMGWASDQAGFVMAGLSTVRKR